MADTKAAGKEGEAPAETPGHTRVADPVPNLSAEDAEAQKKKAAEGHEKAADTHTAAAGAHTAAAGAHQAAAAKK